MDTIIQCSCGLVVKNKTSKHMSSNRHLYLFNKLNNITPFDKRKKRKIEKPVGLNLVFASDACQFSITFDDV